MYQYRISIRAEEGDRWNVCRLKLLSAVLDYQNPDGIGVETPVKDIDGVGCIAAHKDAGGHQSHGRVAVCNLDVVIAGRKVSEIGYFFVSDISECQVSSVQRDIDAWIGGGEIAGAQAPVSCAGVARAVRDFQNIEAVCRVDDGNSRGRAGFYSDTFLNVHIAILSGDCDNLSSGGNTPILADFRVFQRADNKLFIDIDNERIVACCRVQEAHRAVLGGVAEETGNNRAREHSDDGAQNIVVWISQVCAAGWESRKNRGTFARVRKKNHRGVDASAIWILGRITLFCVWHGNNRKNVGQILHILSFHFRSFFCFADGR